MFIPELQQGKAISRLAVTETVHDVRANGSPNSVKETDDALNEEDVPEHSVRLRSRPSPIHSNSDSDEEGPKSDRKSVV